MSSDLKHRKRSHRSEKVHVDGVRQMMQFASAADATSYFYGMGALSAFGIRLFGRRKGRERQRGQ